MRVQQEGKSLLYRKSFVFEAFMSVREQRGSQLSAAISVTMLSANQLPKSFTSAVDEKNRNFRF